jgi:hypothetical protein
MAFLKEVKEQTLCASDITCFGTWKAGAHSGILSELDALLTDIPL